jgi:signal peptidase I
MRAGMRRAGVRTAFVLIATFVGIMVLSTGVRAYAAEAFVVPSGSMLPTLQIGDRLIVDKLSSTIHRGDIVVFRRAPGDHDSEYADLVKRVIGLPGETISSVGDTILIDGKPLAEPWLPKLTGICAQSAADVPTTRIPPGQYFMMGDCRGDSSDSRSWGTVPASNIIGKVTVVVWRHNHPWLHWF